MKKTAVVTASALVLAAAPAWAAGGAALTVSPASVSRGSTVTFAGAGCLRGDSVFLISKLFPGHALRRGRGDQDDGPRERPLHAHVRRPHVDRSWPLHGHRAVRRRKCWASRPTSACAETGSGGVRARQGRPGRRCPVTSGQYGCASDSKRGARSSDCDFGNETVSGFPSET